MVLDRDELAARCLVALLSRGGYVGDAEAQRLGAVVAVGCADALLSALVPVAPAPGAPVAAPSRPEWVNGGVYLHEPRVRRVLRWEGDRPVVGSVMALGDPVREDLPRVLAYGTWTPCAAPSPAATPAAWVPSVGDVVGIDGGNDYGETRVITAVGARVTYARLNSVGAWLCEHTMDVSLLTYLRRATSSERAAAGLPRESASEAPAFDEAKERDAAEAHWRTHRGGNDVDLDRFIAGWLARARRAAPTSKPVDRVALADALHIAWWWREKTTATPWGEIHPDSQADWLRAADAAIAFLNGGAK